MTAAVLLLLATWLEGDLAAARRALEAGRPAEALRLLGDLAEREDADPRALLVAGRARLALGDPSAALDPLLRAAEKLPDDVEVARTTAGACYRTAVSSPGVTHAALLHDALRFAGRAQDPWLQALIEEELGRHERALERYAAAGEAGHDALDVWEGSARCLKALGRADWKEAYGKALELAIERRDFVRAWAVAFAADAGGRLLQWLDAEVAEAPEAFLPRRWRGFARARLLLFEGAIEDLRRATALRPDDVAARRELVGALLRRYPAVREPALLREAEREAQRLLRERPEDREIRRQLHWAARRRFEAGDPERAMELLRFLYDIEPLDLDVALGLAALSRRAGATDEADRIYRALLEAFPDEPDVLNDLAILRDGLGDRAGAVKLWNAAVREDPEHLDALENLFTAAWERGDRGAARRWAALGLRAAELQEVAVDRWKWFSDRL
ncbi:MAG: tetratricopeptide repeat protein, partial [Planctomycetota bacterium]